MATSVSARTGVGLLLTLALLLASVWPQEAAGAVSHSVEVVGAEVDTRHGEGVLDIQVPSQTRRGDLLVAVFSVMGHKHVTGPEGWELTHVDHFARQMTQTIWTRTATGDEDSTYGWNGHDRRATTGTILAVRGADTDNPIGQISAGTSVRSNPIVAPGVATTVEQSLVLGAWSVRDEGKITVDPSMNAVTFMDAEMAMAIAAEPIASATTDTGERIATRASSAGAVGQLLVVNAPENPATSPGQDPEPEPEPDDHDSGGDIDDETGEQPGLDPGQPGVLWSDAGSWLENRVPSSDEHVVIDQHVVLDGSARIKSLEVGPSGVLEFAADTDAVLETTGNVEVAGTLRMNPESAASTHVLRFLDVDEAAFVGGGHQVRKTDVGLWFIGDGRAEVEGSKRTAWSRAATKLGKGDRAVTLEEVPAGWQTGDELVITPTSIPGSDGHSDGYSSGRIVQIEGATVTLDAPLDFDHPHVRGQWGAEVMNMTRNVRIEGTTDGRAHVLFMHTNTAQSIRNAELRHLGPRQATDSTYRSGSEQVAITEGVLGRYPLHFHHAGEGSAGTVVENVVVRDSGHRAFVAHASHGITFAGTIAHDVVDTPYWWDRTTGCCGRNAIWDPPSNDITYERAIASLVTADPPHRGFRLSGFELGHGNNLSVTDSVAVGVQGNRHSAGFNWPEGVAAESGDATIGDHWTFQNNVSHNNRVNGIFTWQNTNDPRHVVESSVMFHNGDFGVIHGAYTNRYTYDDLILYGNGSAGFELHAQGAMPLTNLTFDGAGISQYGFVTDKHRLQSRGARLANARFQGYTDRAIALLSADREDLDIIDPTFSGPESSWFYLADSVPDDSLIRVQLRDGSAFRLHPASSNRGTLVKDWNARQEPIAPFD